MLAVWILARAWVAALLIAVGLDVSCAWFVDHDPEGMRVQALAHGVLARDLDAFLAARFRYTRLLLRWSAIAGPSAVAVVAGVVCGLLSGFVRVFWREVTRPR